MQASAAINNEDQSEVERRHLRRARTVRDSAPAHSAHIWRCATQSLREREVLAYTNSNPFLKVLFTLRDREDEREHKIIREVYAVSGTKKTFYLATVTTLQTFLELILHK